MKQIYYATQSGKATFESEQRGGNPFASALIELARQPELHLLDLPARLRALTEEKSDGLQIVECVGESRRSKWRFARSASEEQEQREALVLVVSDYSASNPDGSLPGAAWDRRRISNMLTNCGFAVASRIKPTREALIQALASFKARSSTADSSIIYSTGHGIEHNGEVYLLPGDYPMHRGFERDALEMHAVAVREISAAACARRVNLVFFAGCRTRSVKL